MATTRRSATSKSIGRSQPAQNKAAQADRRTQAFDLKIQGLSHRQIAAKLGVDHSTVSRWISAECNARLSPRVEEYRAVMLEQLETCMETAMKQVARGGPTALKAIDRVVAITKRVGQITGADAPLKIETSGQLSEAELELQELINEARAKMLVEESLINNPEAADVE